MLREIVVSLRIGALLPALTVMVAVLIVLLKALVVTSDGGVVSALPPLVPMV
jgi:hypothetical protein